MLHARLLLASCVRAKVITTFLLIVALAVFVKAARTYWPSSHSEELRATPVAASHTAVQDKKKSRAVETELITLRPNGFEPAEITRPAGEFILMIENRGGLPADLRLSRETGEHIHEIKSSREEPDWNELLDLHPGHYALTEANHPEWMCHITITAR